MKKTIGYIVCLALWLVSVHGASAQGWFRSGNGMEVRLGDGYDCEKGRFATFKIQWNDKHRTLTVRKGEGRVSDFVISLCFNVEVVGGGDFDVNNLLGRSVVVSKACRAK